MLVFLLWANLFSASTQIMLQEEFPAAKASEIGADALADRLFVFVVPVVILILVYVAFIITRLCFALDRFALSDHLEHLNTESVRDGRTKKRAGFNCGVKKRA